MNMDQGWKARMNRSSRMAAILLAANVFAYPQSGPPVIPHLATENPAPTTALATNKNIPTKAVIASNAVNVNALIDAHHYKQVRELVKARVEKDPHDADALYFMSRVDFAYQKRDEAVSLAQRAVDLNPNNADFRCQLAKSLGDKARNSGFFEKARLAKIMKREGDTALEIDP